MGTIRIPNAPGFVDACIPDKELKEKGERAFVEYLVSFDDIIHPGIRILRWNDSKVFNFAHTTGSAEPTTKVQRWYRGKDNRCHKVEIDMPSVVGKYNKYGRHRQDGLNYRNVSLQVESQKMAHAHFLAQYRFDYG